MGYWIGSRHTILWAIVICYLVPILSLTAFFNIISPPHLIWRGLAIGILLSAAGSLILYFLLTYWELNRRPQSAAPQIVHQNAASEDNHENARLIKELDTKNDEIEQLQREIEKNIFQYETIINEYNTYKIQAREQIEQQSRLLNELKESLVEQRTGIERKQLQISQLETKVSDLTYEIKTLLHLAESAATSTQKESLSPADGMVMYETPFHYSTKPIEEEPDFSVLIEKQISTAHEASLQLKRCLDIAQKITRSSHFAEPSRFRDFSSDSFALDLRRLCDSLRSENNSSILLYSPKEDSLIFANNQVKFLSGWSPDKFVQNFSEIIQDGLKEWKNGIAALSLKNESQVKIILKTRSGQDILVNCHMGMIPTGIFRHHIIAVLYAV